MRILFVDDEPEVLDQAEIFLEKLEDSLEIETTKSVERGLSLLEEGEFDAVISDYQMAGMDGLDFLETVREDRESDIPFIIFTGKGREEVVMEALNLGADRYLRKDEDPETNYEILADATVDEIERHKAEKEEREAKQEAVRKAEVLDGMLENFPASFYAKNRKGEITRASKLYRESRHEEGRDQVIGKTDFDFFSEDLAEEAWEDDKRVMETEEPIVDRQEHTTLEDGTDLYYETSKAPVYDERGNVRGVVGMTKDVTDKVRPKRRLDSLLEYLPLSVYFKDTEGRHTDVSDYMVEGLEPGQAESKEEVIGKTDADLYGEEFAEETRRDEKRIMETKEPVINKLEHFDPGTWEEAFSLTTKAPLIDGEGNVEGILGATMNVTDRIRTERRRKFLHSLLRHDLRNKLQILQGYQELLEDFDLPDEAEEYVEKSENTILESIDLVEKVRTLREVEEAGEEIEEIDLGEVLSQAIEQNESFASEIGVEVNWEECEFHVMGGPLLKELFSNLIENSIEHSGGDLVKISTREEEEECIVSVEDNGKGVPEDKKEKVFERSYTESESTGSGLGLYLVQGIAENYDGSVEVGDSELGGAKFEVHLKKA